MTSSFASSFLVILSLCTLLNACELLLLWLHLSSLHVIHAPKFVLEDQVDAFIDAVSLDGVGSTHEEPGCLRFDVYQNVKDPTEIYLYEVYANPDAFEYHKGTPHIKQWVETVKDMYDTSRDGGSRVGRNVWPPDNWAWSSGKPTW